MKFRTEYTAQKCREITLDPEMPVVLAGSCFSQNMAAKMQDHLWDAVNPTGTLYNPISIGRAISLMIDQNKGLQEFEKSLFYFNGLWSSHYFDSSFSSIHKEDCIEDFKIRCNLLKDKLETGKTLIVTLGTSICYYILEKEYVVGNCHKQPSNLFYTRRLSPEEIFSFWISVNELLHAHYPDVRTIFTVSPVRHLKDGFVKNAQSKAALILGVEEICSHLSGCYYFPAYEILNDDLRDYRFYASDLAHPSEEAIEYIWQKFKETYIDEKGLQTLEAGAKKVKAASHRPKKGALGKFLTS